MSRPDPKTIEDLARRIAAIQPRARRRLIAIAGAPASGKSTLAEELVAKLGARAALVPMDGYHLDNRLLEGRGLLARKGAPETFDAEGFVHMVRRLAGEKDVVVPVFDRARDIAIAGAHVVGPGTEVVVVEGNYLLLEQAPWSELQGLWDMTVFLDVGEGSLTDRLIQRWRDHGLDGDAAETRARSNDLPNALLVTRHSARADVRIGDADGGAGG